MSNQQAQVDKHKEQALTAWLNNPLAEFQQISKLAGISDKTFYRYRHDDAFMEEYHKRQSARFKSMEGKAIAKLEEELDKNNWNAIKYALDGAGYAAAQKVESTNTIINLTIEGDEE